MPSKPAGDTEIYSMKRIPPGRVPEVGKSSSYTCAHCGGPLEEIREGSVLRFRCQVGHGFSAHALLLGRLQKSEDAIWSLVSSFMESSRLSELLGNQARKEGMTAIARKLKRVRDECADLADLFRDAILKIPDVSLDEKTPEHRRST